MIVFRVAAMICGALLIAISPSTEAQQVPQTRQFTPGQKPQVRDLPAGKFRNKIERLPLQARDRAMAWLDKFHFTTEDLNSLQADAEGGIYYEDNFQLADVPAGAEAGPTTSEAAVPINPFPA